MGYKRLMEAEKGTTVEVEHSLIGYREGGWKKWRAKIAKSLNPGGMFSDKIHVPTKEELRKYASEELKRAQKALRLAREKEKQGDHTTAGILRAHARDAKLRAQMHRERLKKNNPESEAAHMFEKFHGEPSESIVEFVDSEHYHGNLAACGLMVGLKVRTIHGDDITIGFESKQANPKRNRGPIGEASRMLSSASSYGPIGALYREGSRIGKGIDNRIGKAIRGNKNKKNPGYSPVALLCTNENGTQLYIVGGDQKLDLKALKIPEKDSVVIGEAWSICYRTRKKFDDFQEIDYVHGFGEENAHPRLRKSADLWEDANPPEKLFGTGELPILRYDVLNERMHLDGGVYKIKKPVFGVSPGIEN